MTYTIRKAKKRGETYPRGVLVETGRGTWKMETMEIAEVFQGYSVRFGWTTYATFPTLDEAATWLVKALDTHFNREAV